MYCSDSYFTLLSTTISVAKIDYGSFKFQHYNGFRREAGHALTRTSAAKLVLTKCYVPGAAGRRLPTYSDVCSDSYCFILLARRTKNHQSCIPPLLEPPRHILIKSRTERPSSTAINHQ
jgi:hypothetical protein